MYQNRPEWVVVDLGIQQIGAISVPVYPTISAREYEYIFNEAEVKLAFVGKGDLFDKVTQAQTNVPSLQTVYTFDQIAGRPFWKDIFSSAGMDQVKYLRDGIQSHELVTIIYTSGTTGNPKGVMLTHDNVMHSVESVMDIAPLSSGDRVLSFLPICHIFERAALYFYTKAGLSVSFTGTDNLGGEQGDLQAVKPHFFTTVPRLLEKVYERILEKGEALTGAKRKLFFWALSLTEDFSFDKDFGFFGNLKRRIADKLIFSKWRAALGGNIKGIVVGAAACPERILRVFNAAGIPIREGYGLTETSPGLAIGRFEKGGAMLSTVGPVLKGVKLLIDTSDGFYRPEEGEILAQGPNVMQGYYQQPGKTAEVFKEMNGERWFCTGDVGKLVKGPGGNQFLQITDRKKELLKTSGGKYVAPAPIEAKFREEFLIEQMMVIGEKRKFVSALIVPAGDALKHWCEQQHINWVSLPEAIRDPKVVQCYQEIVDRINPLFSHIEQVKKFVLIPRDWAPVTADGSESELTPTLKLKRRVILDKYKGEIEGLYRE